MLSLKVKLEDLKKTIEWFENNGTTVTVAVKTSKEGVTFIGSNRLSKTVSIKCYTTTEDGQAIFKPQLTETTSLT